MLGANDRINVAFVGCGMHFQALLRSGQAPVYNALRGYQVMAGIKLGTESYRNGRVMAAAV